jgi:hypothetical protein
MHYSFRGALVALLACGAWAGCDSNTPETPADAGTLPWDGTAVPLEEKGDFAYPAPFASCTLRHADDAGTPIACGSPESFDLSTCDRGSLSALAPSGFYALLGRVESSPVFYTAPVLALSSDGGTERAFGVPLVDKRMDAQTFYVASLRTRPDGGSTRYAYAGCSAENAEHFTGCFQTCTNGGAQRTGGTFDGVRMQRVAEPESSGGLALTSERRVELGLPVDIYVHKNHAYVVSIKTNISTNGGLTVFDVTDRAQPVLRKSISLPADNYWNGVWAKGDALYIASKDKGVNVFDISNPADPVFVRSLPGEAINVHTVLVDGERLYANTITAGTVRIYDVSQPLNPVQLGRYTVPHDANTQGTPYAHDSFAYQNRLYINQMGQGYYVVDVSDPANGKPLGSYTYDAHAYNPTHHSAVGTFAGRTIAFEGGENIGAHLRVLDVTDPAHIVKIGEVRMRKQTSIHNILLVGSRLYVAWYVDGVRVFDVSNPTAPKQVAHYNTFRDTDPGRLGDAFEGAIGIRVPGDGFVYVVDTSRGLLIFREP